MKTILHHLQAGFIPGMQGLFNILKSIHVLQHTKKMQDKNCMIISTDAKKAYDIIHLPFMIKQILKEVDGKYVNIGEIVYDS